jgi:hypothetical protein
MRAHFHRWVSVAAALVTSYFAAAGPARAAVNPAVVPPPVMIKALPDLAVTVESPAFTLGQACNTGGPAIIFHIKVRNQGLGPSAPIMQQQAGVMIQTSMTNGHVGSVWSVAAALPAIPAHGSVALDVALMPLDAASTMSGTHVFSIAVNPIGIVKELSTSNNAVTTTVMVPSGFCGHRINMTQPVLQHALVTPSPLSKTLETQSSGSAQNLVQQTYDTLDFKITTGSDDLRGDSSVEVDLFFPDGTGSTCVIKGQNDDGWSNGSTHEVPCRLTKQAETLENIAKATIHLDMHSCQCQLGENTDNWNIERFWMGAYQSGSNAATLCAFSASGDPLVRLKPSIFEATGGTYGYGTYGGSTDISDFPSHC